MASKHALIVPALKKQSATIIMAHGLGDRLGFTSPSQALTDTHTVGQVGVLGLCWTLSLLLMQHQGFISRELAAKGKI